MLACNWTMEPSTQRNQIPEVFPAHLFPALFSTHLGSQKWTKAGKMARSPSRGASGLTCLLPQCAGSTCRTIQEALRASGTSLTPGLKAVPLKIWGFGRKLSNFMFPC